YVVALSCRQAGIPNFFRQPKPAKNLHRTRRYLVALDVRWFAGMPDFDDGHVDAARSKIDGKREANWACADNQDRGFNRMTHGAVRSYSLANRRDLAWSISYGRRHGSAANKRHETLEGVLNWDLCNISGL